MIQPDGDGGGSPCSIDFSGSGVSFRDAFMFSATEACSQTVARARCSYFEAPLEDPHILRRLRSVITPDDLSRAHFTGRRERKIMYTSKLTIAQTLAKELLDVEMNATEGGVLDNLSERFHPIYVPTAAFSTDVRPMVDFFAHGPDGLWTMGGLRNGRVILLSRRDNSAVRIYVPRFVGELFSRSLK